jgi:integrase
MNAEEQHPVGWKRRVSPRCGRVEGLPRLAIRAHNEDEYELGREILSRDDVDITTNRVRAYAAMRQGEGAANASINRELAALKRMFSLAVQDGRLGTMPFIPTLEEDNVRQGFVDHAAFEALRKNLPEYLKDPVTFLYLSGWRLGEMKALEWRDVLPLSGELLEIMERAHAKRRLDCPYVFHRDGEAIGDFRKAWSNACKASGLGRTLVHDLRRTSPSRFRQRTGGQVARLTPAASSCAAPGRSSNRRRSL